MLAQHLPFRGNDDPFRIDPQAHRPVGEGCRYAVAVALEVYEAGRRYPPGVLHQAVKGTGRRHRADHFAGMHIGDGAGQSTMPDPAPLLNAALFEPGVQGILHVLLDPALLPPGSRVAERGLEQIMTGHRGKPGVDLPRLAGADPVDSSLHIVEHPAPGHAARRPERPGRGIEQHLVGPEQISAHDECPAMRQPGMGHLQLDPFAEKANNPICCNPDRPNHRLDRGQIPTQRLDHQTDPAQRNNPVIKLAAGRQSGVGGDSATVELELQAAVAIEPKRLINRFTRRVRHMPRHKMRSRHFFL